MTPGTSYSPPPAFGRFRLQHQIGAGVLGPVFRTNDEQEPRLVAVKAFTLDITPERAEELSNRLQRIVEMDLEHPHIATPIATGVEASVAYLAQQYVEGESLDAAIRQYGPAPAADVLRMIGHVAEALDVAALVGVFHGSLHPRDIMVTPVETRVTGLGVSMALEGIGQHGPIRRPYAAPERESGLEWGAAADVFSLAVIAYEVLTGRRALPGTEQPFPGLADLQVHDVAALREILETAIDPDPDRRPAKAHDFASALAPTLVDAGAARAPGDRGGGSRRKIKTRPPKLPGLDDPLSPQEASAAVPPTPAEEREPAPVVDIAMPAAPAEDHRERIVDWDVAEAESDYGLDEAVPLEPHAEVVVPILPAPAVDPPRAEWDEADTAVESSLFTPEPAEPPSAPSRSAGPDSAVDDARDAGQLGLDLPVPRALDPTRGGESFSRPSRRFDPVEASQPDRPWAPIAIAAAAGLLLGLLGGYEMGARLGQRTPATAVATRSAPAGEPVSRPAAAAPAPVAAPSPAVPPPAAPAVAVTAPAISPAPPKPVEAPPATPVVPRTEAPRTSGGKAPAKTVAATVAPRKSAAASTTISFNSRPAGARVILDGKNVGTTPLTLNKVAAGRHTVELRLAGYGAWTTSITVEAGKPQRVTGSLERIISR